MIHQNFDEIYGWAQLYYKVQLYDVDFDRLIKIREGEPHYVEESHFSDDERFVETDDGSIKELVFVQDLLTETVDFNPEISTIVKSEGNDYDMYDYTDYSFSSEREVDTIAEPSETMFSARSNGSISDQIAAEPLQVPAYYSYICPSPDVIKIQFFLSLLGTEAKT